MCQLQIGILGDRTYHNYIRVADELTRFIPWYLQHHVEYPLSPHQIRLAYIQESGVGMMVPGYADRRGYASYGYRFPKGTLTISNDNVVCDRLISESDAIFLVWRTRTAEMLQYRTKFCKAAGKPLFIYDPDELHYRKRNMV